MVSLILSQVIFLIFFFAPCTGYENCPSFDDDNTDVDTSELSQLIYQRLKITYKEPLVCLAKKLLSYPHAVFQWAQQQFS